jgi:hypothetical protein
MDVADSRSLRCARFVRLQHLLRQFTYISFRLCLGNECAARIHATPLLLFMVLWAPIFAMLYNMEVPMSFYASMFMSLGMCGLLTPFSLLIGGFHYFSCKKLH